MTDLGMTGPQDSVLGRDVDAVTTKLISGLPGRFPVAENDVALEGAIVNINKKTGRANSIKSIRIKV